MKTDLYTKTVLTVMAVALSINLLSDFDIITKTYANETSAFAPMQVEIVSVDLKSMFNVVDVGFNSIFLKFAITLIRSICKF